MLAPQIASLPRDCKSEHFVQWRNTQRHGQRWLLLLFFSSQWGFSSALFICNSLLPLWELWAPVTSTLYPGPQDLGNFHSWSEPPSQISSCHILVNGTTLSASVCLSPASPTAISFSCLSRVFFPQSTILCLFHRTRQYPGQSPSP